MKASFYRGTMILRSFTVLAICGVLALPNGTLLAKKLGPQSFSNSSYLIHTNGALDTWGSNSNGQLGNGTTTDKHTPQTITFPSGVTSWTAVAAGEYHTLAIGNDGNLYTWGLNNYGQLGTGHVDAQDSTPQKVMLPGGVTCTAVAAGVYHSLAIGSDGNLYAWGYNEDGELGIGNYNVSYSTPQKVLLPVTCTAVAAGSKYSLAIGSDGNLYAWGSNTYGQLGIGNTTGQNTPQVVTLPNGVTDWTAVAAGDIHSLAIGSNDSLYAWGDNLDGQLGIGTLVSPPYNTPQKVLLPVTCTAVAAGFTHNLALGGDGNLYAWGYNGWGQLGLGNFSSPDSVPQAVLLPTGVTSWTAVSAGYNHSLAIGSDGNLYAWGNNFYGQLGNDTTDAIAHSTPALVLPSPPRPFLPANNSVNQRVDNLLFKWRSSSSATKYLFQLSASSTFSSYIANDSSLADTTTTISGLTNLTRYFWRLSAYNAGGYGAFSSVDSFTTIIAAPAAPTVLLPANNATDQSVNNLVFKWNTSSTATDYVFQLSESSTFLSYVVNDSNVTDTTRTVSGLSNSTPYYWRVSAYNAGGYSAPSPVDTFTTAIPAPAAPTILLPANNTTNQSVNNLVFKWSTSSTATKYLFQLSLNNTFSSFVVNDTNVTDTTTSVSALTNSTKYYWRVSAYNAGGYGAFSSVDSFTTIIAAPAPPTVLVPPNNSTNQRADTLAFKWSTSSTATKYLFQLSSSGTFSSYVVNDSNVTDTTRTVTGLANLTKYFWRVSAYNAGGYSTPSTVAAFTTIIAAPVTPTALLPANGSTNQSVNNLVFKWSTSSTATNYVFQLSSNNMFSSYVVNDSTLSDTTRTVSGLANLTPYYWRVTAYNAGGYSTPSTVATFTTIIAAPGSLTILVPTNTATNQRADTLVFKWTSNSTATKYLFQLSSSGTFASYVVNDSNVADTTTKVTGLANSTKYFCRVSAYNAGGYGTFSQVDTFTTIIAIPAAPTVLLPPNNSVNQRADTLAFKWSTSSTATKYLFQLSPNGTFSSYVVNDSNVTDTTRTVTGLTNLTKYFCRVSAYNAGGYSAFSPVDTFTTIIAIAAAPTVLLPANNSVNQRADTLLFKWKTSSTATKYLFQLSSSGTFSSYVVNDSNVTDTTRKVTGLTNLTKYFCRVSAYNAGGYSSFSAIDTFTTIIAIPLPPAVLSLKGASYQRADTLALKWHPSASATKYLFQLSLNGAFSSYALNDSNVTDTTRKVTGLTNLTKYFWRVSAYDAGGYSAFSVADSFTTIVAVPAEPLLASPLGTLGQPRRETLTWNPSSNATKYRLQIALDSAFSKVAFDTTTADTSKKLSIPLSATTKYYWHVSAADTGGTSNYSTTAEFTTGTGIDALDVLTGIPKVFALFQNYPNPFNPSTTIRYDLPKNAYVKITIYDILGRVVTNLVDGAQMASKYSIQWNPWNLSSGVYFCRIQAQSQDGSGRFISVKKLLYLK